MCQTPPPAGVMYASQSFFPHSSSTAIEVVRPPATYVFGTYRNEVRKSDRGYNALLGPICSQSASLPLPWERAAAAVNASRAPSISATEIVLSG